MRLLEFVERYNNTANNTLLLKVWNVLPPPLPL